MPTSTILKTAWHRASSIPMQYPFVFGVVLSGFKTSLSDLLVQKVVERREKVDWRRNMAFAAFGFIYLGGIQYTLYVPIFGKLFPRAASFAAKSLREKARDVQGMMQLVLQVALDQMIHHPLLYFPAFYCTKELVMKKDPNLSKCLQEYRHNMWEDLMALWKIWVPATMINFAFCPMYARIPFVAGVSLLWTCILSSMRGGDVAHGDDLVGGEVTSATLTILTEGLSELFTTSPAELDRDKAHVILSASGPDRVGWVSLLARTVADQGGSVTESKMVRLGEEFIILMHVAVAPDQKKPLIQALQTNDSLKPLNIQTNSISRRKTGLYDKAVIGLRIHCIGEDKPGMLAAISEMISSKGLSIENVVTELRMGKGGRRNFCVNIDCTSSSYSDKENLTLLVRDVATLKESLGLDILDIRVHTD